MNLSALREKWDSLSRNKKIILVVMSVAIILSVAFFVQWLTRVEYAELFSGMEADAAGEVTTKLQELGVTYKLADQGSTILVPKNQVYDLRLQLAVSGVITSGGMGFELFNESKIGITDFERQLNYQRALQEELRRTIIQLEAVEQARVHIVIPEQSLFIKDQGQASASIVLKLAPMAMLHPDQVIAIVNLVSGSVDRLEPQNVNVIDTQGTVLSEGLFDDTTGTVVSQGKQLEQKIKFEKNLEQRVQALLQQILGSGSSVTMVTAELDYDHREVTRIEFGEAHVRSEQTLDEQHLNRGDGGVVGQEDLQDIGTIYPELDGGDSASSILEDITNYELDQTQETVIYAPGRLISLSTAVAIDGALNDEMVETIEQVVSAAIGYNPDRGDQIAVTSMEFNKSAIEEAEALMAELAETEKRQERIKLYITLGVSILAIILAFILIRMVIKSYRQTYNQEPVLGEPVTVAQMEEEIEIPVPVKDEATKRQELVQKVAQEQPGETASLLKQWLMDD